MAYDFKNLSTVEVQDKPTENTTVMAFENGSPRQIPSGEFGGKGLVVDLRGYTLSTDESPTIISDISYNPIYEALMEGRNVVFQIQMADLDFFAEPMISSSVTGRGFVVMLFPVDTTPLQLLFTNGSYHTA